MGVFSLRKYSIKPFLILILVLIATLNIITPVEGWTFWKYDTKGDVLSVAASIDGNFIVAGIETAEYKGKVLLLDKSGRKLWEKAFDDEVECVSTSEDANYTVAGIDRYTGNDLSLLDKDGKIVWQKDLTGTPLDVDISSNGEYIVAGDTKNFIYCFNKTGTQLWRYEAGERVDGISISSSGEYVVAGSWDNKVYFLNNTGGLVWSCNVGTDLYAVSVSPEGDYVVAGGSYNLSLFDKKGVLLWTSDYFGTTYGVSVSGNGEYVAIADTYRDTFALLGGSSGEVLWTWAAGDMVNDVDLPLDGEYVIAGSDDGYIYFLENLSPSTITCGRSKSQVFLGEGITISGSIDPPHGGVVVVLTYTRPNTTILQRNVTTSKDGSYSDAFSPDQAGLWKVKASWSGDADNMGAASSTIKFIVSTVRRIALKIGEAKTLSEWFEPPGSYSKPIGGDIVYSESIKKSDYLSFKTERVVITFSGILNNIIDRINITYTVGVLEIAPAGVYTLNVTYTFQKTFLGSLTTLFTYEIRLSIEAGTLKTPTTISCAVSPTSVPVGETVTVSGVITPTCGGVPVTLNYTKPDATTTTSTVMTDANGTYTEEFIPDSVGIWYVKASWNGDEKHMGAESQKFWFKVVKASSAISCSVSPASIIIGSTVTVSGSISPAHSGATVTLTYTSPNGSVVTRTVTTGTVGGYTDTYTPDRIGSWSVKASWPGDGDHEGAESQKFWFKVVKASSAISCSPSSTQITMGASIDIQGSLTPPLSGVNVTLTYTKPDQTTAFTRTVTTASGGTFKDTYTPNVVGSWSVVVSWPGNENYDDCEDSTSFTVLEPLASIFDYLLRSKDILGLLLAIASLVGGSFAWFMRRKKKERVKALLDEIDNIYSSFKMNARRCEAELLSLRERSLAMLKGGKIDESNYGLLKERINEYLQEIREQIEKEGSKP